MFCLHCGKKIDDNSTFCRFCGKAVNPIAKDINNKSNKRNNGGFFSIIIAIPISIFSFILKLISKLFSGLKNLVFFILNFIKRFWKWLLGIVFLAIAIILSVIGYYYYTEQIENEQYERLREKMTYKLNNFENPDSVYLISKDVLQQSHVTLEDEERGLGTWPYREKAIENMKKLAEMNYVDAQFVLGLYYSGYDLVDKTWHEAEHFSDNRINHEKSTYWYLQAANNGHSGAMNNLGTCYKEGRGVKQDMVNASYWFRKATEAGDDGGYGALNLGDCFRDGVKIVVGSHWEKIPNQYYYYFPTKDGYTSVDDYKEIIPCNLDSAMYYWRLADERGCPTAKERLQKIYE